MLNPLPKNDTQGIPLPLIQFSHFKQTLRERCFAVGPHPPEQ